MSSARMRGRARTLEAIVLVATAAAAQKWVPMTRWSRLLGRPAPVPDSWRGEAVTQLPSRAATATERQVAASVRRASQLLPWQPSCLAQAAAGQMMLRQRREPGVVVIGLQRPQSQADWKAHAWLIGREGALTGGAAASGFTATTVFAVRGSSPPDWEAVGRRGTA